MYLCDLPGTTLEELASVYDEKLMVWGGTSQEVSVNLEADEPTVRFGQHETFAPKEAQAGLAKYFDIPPKFFLRIDPEQRQWLLTSQIERADDELSVFWNDSRGLAEVRKAGEIRVRPHRLVERALVTFPAESPIVNHWFTADELRVDVIFPPEDERATGGDARVGDITRGGVRIGQDRKNNLAPWVQPYLYRLICTNGMEVPDSGLKINAQGATELEIEAMFEAEVSRAADRLVSDIEAFYALREERIGNDPTGALRRMALEQRLPARTVGNLEDLVPSLADPANASVFDLVNLITNQANNPEIDRRSSTYRNLQRAGGGIVADHAERCSACHSRLG